MIRRLLVLLALALPATARADIPPDPDSADAHCTKAEQCPTGETCPYAFRPGDRSGESETVGADCREQMRIKGLEQRCRNGGNYSGENLFCPPGATGSWSPPGQPKPAPTPAPEPAPEPTPAPAPKPEPAPLTPPSPEATTPSKASMCSLTGGSPGLFALLLLARRRRR